MPANDQKIVQIMFSEIDSVEERCKNYHDELKDAVAEIIAAERAHRVARTNIDQQVADKINAVGSFLATERSIGNMGEDSGT